MSSALPFFFCIRARRTSRNQKRIPQFKGVSLCYYVISRAELRSFPLSQGKLSFPPKATAVAAAATAARLLLIYISSSSNNNNTKKRENFLFINCIVHSFPAQVGLFLSSCLNVHFFLFRVPLCRESLSAWKFLIFFLCVRASSDATSPTVRGPSVFNALGLLRECDSLAERLRSCERASARLCRLQKQTSRSSRCFCFCFLSLQANLKKRKQAAFLDLDCHLRNPSKVKARSDFI